MNKRNTLINLTVTIISIIASVVLLEITIRYIIGPPCGRTSNKLYDPILLYRFNPKLKDIDSAGFRNEKVLKAVDIVALGDSHTYGANVPSKESWPQQLSKATHLSVYNFGVGSYGMLHYKYLIDKAIDLDPEYIILGLYVANDFVKTYELFFLDYWSNLPQEIIEEKAYDSHLENGHQENIIITIIKKTSIFKAIKIFGKKYMPLNKRKEFFITYGDEHKKIKYKRLEVHATLTDLEHEGNRNRFQLLKEILLEMKNKTDKKNIQFGIVFIPTMENAFYDYLTENDFNFPDIYKEEVQNERHVIKDLEDYLLKIDTPWVDALPYVSNVIYKGVKVYPSWDEGHPLQAGYREYARAANDLIILLNKQ